MRIMLGSLHPACGHGLEASQVSLLSYFDESKFYCATCGEEVDIWTAIRNCFVGAGAVFWLLNPLRGFTLIAEVRLHRDQLSHIDLSEYGVAPGSLIRGVNFTQNGGKFSEGLLVPALVFGNEMRLARLPEYLGVIPAAVGDDPPEYADFSMFVQFLLPETQLHRQLIVEAAYAHGDHHYRRAVIDAHTAADSLLEQVLLPILKSTADAKLRLGFTEKVKVLSALRTVAGAPELPRQLTASLRELNKQRNRVAHPPGGADLNEEKSADLLTATLLLIELLESESATGGHRLPR